MPTARRLKLADLDAALAKDIGELRRRVVLAVHETAGTGAMVVRANAPRAFGELSDGIVGQSRGDQGARIRSTAPHSAAVEVGSRPHMPPVGPLIAWVKLRGMQGLEKGSKGAPKAVARMIRGQGSRIAVPVDAAEQVAWAIAFAIKKRGTKPTWFMKRSLPEIRGILGANLKDWLSRPL